MGEREGIGSESGTHSATGRGGSLGRDLVDVRVHVVVAVGRDLPRVCACVLCGRYSDIVTVYSAQGSQAKNVHVHAGRFKGKRNLLYTACTRAIEKLKISGIEMGDGGVDLRTKMELHPKSVLWQVDRVGVDCFSSERVSAARLAVRKQARRH